LLEIIVSRPGKVYSRGGSLWGIEFIIRWVSPTAGGGGVTKVMGDSFAFFLIHTLFRCQHAPQYGAAALMNRHKIMNRHEM
jgi:hypothetical protein